MQRRVDPAVLQARRVVGLYGDPDVSWSIVMALDLAEPITSAAVAKAAESLVSAYPHLGRTPALETFDTGDEAGVLARLADTPYNDQEPLLRVALSEAGTTLIVAGHHGALDGLGLLGAAGQLAGLDLTSSARGIAPTDEPGGFATRSLGRLVEVLAAPPLRLAAPAHPATGDVLMARVITATRPGSAALVAAAAGAVRRWNAAASTRAPGRRLVIAMGLSRRAGTPSPTPDRDTAYVRLVADDVRTTGDAQALLAGTAPEPAFPVTDASGLAPRLIRLLSSRLGSTLLASNLGRVDHPGLVSLRFWPVPTGPAGVALGLASTPNTTTVMVRARRGWFTEQATAELTDLVASELETSAQ